MAPTSMEKLHDEIVSVARGHSMAVWGVADLTLLSQKKPDILSEVGRGAGSPDAFTRAIVMGVRLQHAVVEGLADGPTLLYFHLYRQANYQLDRAAFELADVVQKAGYAAAAIPASQVIGRNPMRGHLSHKLLGWAAGIGWIGRSSLLVHPEYGAGVRYVSVLTDAPLAAGTPHGGSCGECRRCAALCPAHAIHDSFRDFDLDACYEKLCEFSRMPGIGQHICGLCVKACMGIQGSEFRVGKPKC